jgi:hypothetical protein
MVLGQTCLALFRALELLPELVVFILQVVAWVRSTPDSLVLGPKSARLV